MSDEARFWAKVDKNGPLGCWVWQGALSNGYGYFGNGATRQAHRIAYELLVGPIPEGMTLDHLCRNRACVNTAHLEPVTNRENILRGISPSAQNARKTHCSKGHELTEDNIYPQRRGKDGQTVRGCRECRRFYSKRWNDRNAKARNKAVWEAKKAARAEGK